MKLIAFMSAMMLLGCGTDPNCPQCELCTEPKLQDEEPELYPYCMPVTRECPEGWSCMDTICVPIHSRPEGTSCTADEQCTDGTLCGIDALCVEVECAYDTHCSDDRDTCVQLEDGSATCLPRCSPTEVCNGDEYCTQVDESLVCLRSGVREVGEACSSFIAPCRNGLTCYEGSCQEMCNTSSDPSSVCGSGNRCCVVDDVDYGVCQPADTPGGACAGL